MIRGKFLTSFDDTSAVRDIRTRVFVQEQGYALENEFDRYDDMAIYALTFDDQGAPAGTARLIMDEDNHAVIGRVCVLPECRGQGMGDLMMRMLLYRVTEMELSEVYLGAQLHAVPFYQRYGFQPFGEIYLDEGQPHRRMRVALDDINLEGACHGHGQCAGCAGDCSDCASSGQEK